MALVTSKMTVPPANREGKLVVVPLKPGVGIKLHEGEARAAGLLPPLVAETKKREPVSNKKRTPTDAVETK